MRQVAEKARQRLEAAMYNDGDDANDAADSGDASTTSSNRDASVGVDRFTIT
jgi:hypothetical protein